MRLSDKLIESRDVSFELHIQSKCMQGHDVLCWYIKTAGDESYYNIFMFIACIEYSIPNVFNKIVRFM